MPGAPPSRVAAIEQLGGYEVNARLSEAQTPCRVLLRQERMDTTVAAPSGWTLVGRIRRPTERNELTAVYRRQANP